MIGCLAETTTYVVAKPLYYIKSHQFCSYEDTSVINLTNKGGATLLSRNILLTLGTLMTNLRLCGDSLDCGGYTSKFDLHAR